MLWAVILFSVFVIAPLVWLIYSIKIVGPDEMAVKVIFGEPVEFCDSGWVFDLRLPPGKRFKCFLQRYPKKMYNFDYRAREVITKAGEEDDVQYGAQKLIVDAVAYLNFPREVDEEFDVEKDADGNITRVTHPLIKILRAGVPIEEEKLKGWTEEAVVGALRLAFGQITWMKAVKDMKAINGIVGENFKDADGALIKAGFREKGIKLVVAEIRLPKSVEDALTLPEKARLEADAAQKVAEAQAIVRVETILYTMARSRGVKLEDIKEEIKNNPKLQRELLQYAKNLHAQLEKAEKGAFFEFNAPGKSGLDKTLFGAIALLKRTISSGQQTKSQKTREEEEEEGSSEKTRSGSKKKQIRAETKSFKELTEETRQQREEIEREKKK